MPAAHESVLFQRIPDPPPLSATNSSPASLPREKPARHAALDPPAAPLMNFDRVDPATLRRSFAGALCSPSVLARLPNS
jgi:hypothetical protein